MGGYSIDPTQTNSSGAMPQQGAAVAKPSLWDRWIQNAYSLRPLGATLSQAGNNLGQRSINMLHGDGFRPDAQVYPPPPPPQALAARPPTNPPVRGGVSAPATGQGATQASQYNNSPTACSRAGTACWTRYCWRTSIFSAGARLDEAMQGVQRYSL